MMRYVFQRKRRDDDDAMFLRDDMFHARSRYAPRSYVTRVREKRADAKSDLMQTRRRIVWENDIRKHRPSVQRARATMMRNTIDDVEKTPSINIANATCKRGTKTTRCVTRRNEAMPEMKRCHATMTRTRTRTRWGTAACAETQRERGDAKETSAFICKHAIARRPMMRKRREANAMRCRCEVRYTQTTWPMRDARSRARRGDARQSAARSARRDVYARWKMFTMRTQRKTTTMRQTSDYEAQRGRKEENATQNDMAKDAKKKETMKTRTRCEARWRCPTTERNNNEQSTTNVTTNNNNNNTKSSCPSPVSSIIGYPSLSFSNNGNNERTTFLLNRTNDIIIITWANKRNASTKKGCRRRTVGTIGQWRNGTQK